MNLRDVGKEDTSGLVPVIEEFESTALSALPVDINKDEEEFHDEDGVDQLFSEIDPKYWNANYLLALGM